MIRFQIRAHCDLKDLIESDPDADLKSKDQKPSKVLRIIANNRVKFERGKMQQIQNVSFNLCRYSALFGN